MLTTEQKRRVQQSIAETEKFLNRETAYPKHLQNLELIETYTTHLAKLKNMLQ